MAWFRTWLDGGTAEGDERPARDGGGSAGDGGGRGDRGDDAGSRERVTDGGPSPDRTTAGSARNDRPGLPGDRDIVDDDGFPGERLGLPENGPGSVATLPRRAGQFALDALLAGLVAGLFTYPDLPQNWSLLSWAILLVVPLATIGMTPAMAMLGMRAVRIDRPASAGVGLVWAVVRTALVFFVLPAMLVDRDVRGIHDRLSRMLVVRTR